MEHAKNNDYNLVIDILSTMIGSCLTKNDVRINKNTDDNKESK